MGGHAEPFRSYFYPRSPCGERLAVTSLSSKDFKISIHALLAESDARHKRETNGSEGISIHALLAESDDHSVCSSSQ